LETEREDPIFQLGGEAVSVKLQQQGAEEVAVGAVGGM
jgi:hypothetical protein